MREERGKSNTSRLILGLFILGAGIFFVYDRLGGWDLGALLRFWPVAFLLVGLTQLLEARDRRAWLGAGIWLAAGTLLLLTTLDLLPFHLSDFLPLLISLLGLHLVRRSFARPGGGEEPRKGASPWVRALTLMGGIERPHRSQRFAGGDVTAVMGGCEVDLTRAAIEGGEAVLDTFAFWGGIDLRVPEGWEVKDEVLPILGGFEDKTARPSTPPSGRLRLRGFAIMGGIEVRN